MDTYSLSKSRMANAGWLSLTVGLLATGHGFYLLPDQTVTSWVASGPIVLWVFVLPIFVFCLFDYRNAILLSVAATPFFYTPSIPHFFTQGLGDVFATASVLGFLLKNRWRIFQYKAIPELIFFLIPLASLFSIVVNLPSFGEFNWQETKDGVADAAGLLLAVSYTYVLSNSIRSLDDFKVFAMALVVAAAVSIIYGLVSYDLLLQCVGGFNGTVITPGYQIAGGFNNPNYYASWLSVLVPTLMGCIVAQKSRIMWKSFFIVLLIFLVYLIMFTLSRAGLIASIAVLFFGLFVKDKILRALAFILLLLITLFASNVFEFRIWHCYNDANDKSLVRYLLQNNLLATEKNKILSLAIDKVAAPPQAAPPQAAPPQAAPPQAAPPRVPIELIKHDRRDLSLHAINAWASSPFFGIGTGNLSKYVELKTGKPNKSHNIILTILAEQGVLGLCVWFLLGGVVLQKLWKIRQDSEGIGVEYVKISGILFLVFLSLAVTSMFSDQYRSIWLWQFVGLVFSPFLAEIKYRVEGGESYRKHNY